LALILNIDTATETASVCVSLNGNPLALLENAQQREHASFIHAAIEQVLSRSGHTLNEIQAFAVTSGPGSYTGLRVGLATAKGFCYALRKPMITINSLEVMAKAAIDTIKDGGDETLLCPMIEARRMEVFTAVYDKNLQIVLSPQPLILTESSFNNYLLHRMVVFFGSGSKKFKAMAIHANSRFYDIHHTAQHLGILSHKAFRAERFSDITYSEPEYFKDFHSANKI
jgi:tRNA threonylcarbamoyladenosine biosynthesis protein TsaB